jgi:type IV secretion system protein VirD4
MRAVSKLFNWRVTSQEACQAFWPRQQPVVSLPHICHSLTVAPTGLGKNISIISPFLRTCAESCVVIDFKGENAIQTAAFRQRVFGNRVVILDPYGVTPFQSDTFNPVDFILAQSPFAIDDCNDLANAVVQRTGEEKEPHWNDSAEMYISAVTAMVVAYGERNHGTRSLHTVREILAHPQKLEMAIKAMLESEHWDGLLAQMGSTLLNFADKERSSVLTSALRHLRFLASPAIIKNTCSSSFDPAELRNGRMTIFLVLPPDRAHAQAGLLRMWIGSLLRACVRGGLQ